jgi:hypothetical protein
MATCPRASRSYSARSLTELCLRMLTFSFGGLRLTQRNTAERTSHQPQQANAIDNDSDDTLDMDQREGDL